MNKDISYLVRTNKGLLVVNINKYKIESYFHPCECIEQKITFYGDFIYMNGHRFNLNICDIVGNGDDSNLQNKGYGTELVLSTLYIIDYYWSTNSNLYNKDTAIIFGQMSISGDLYQESSVRRAFFWGKFFNIHNVNDPLSRFHGCINNVLDDNCKYDIYEIKNSHAGYDISVLIKVLNWTDDDEKAISEVTNILYQHINEFDYDSYENKLCRYNKIRNILFNINSSAHWFIPLVLFFYDAFFIVIIFWGLFYLYYSNHYLPPVLYFINKEYISFKVINDKKNHAEKMVMRDVINIDKLKFGLIKRWLQHVSHLKINEIESDYLNGLYLNKRNIDIIKFKCDLFDSFHYKYNSAATETV